MLEVDQMRRVTFLISANIGRGLLCCKYSPAWLTNINSSITLRQVLLYLGYIL